jgi:hydrogenase expression/formation protein HypD
LVRKVFQVSSRKWRGVGEIPQSGLALRAEFARYDAEQRFGVAEYRAEESSLCISGAVLRGVKKPQECSAFGTLCTPEHPLGATMVSNEGACAAYYQYRRRELKTQAASAGSAAD